MVEKTKMSLLTDKTLFGCFHFFFIFSLFRYVFFSFQPLVWSGHLNYHNWHFSTASATFPLHCINYRAGINLTVRSSDRSTQVCSSLAIRWNHSFSFIFHARHIVYVQRADGNTYSYCDPCKSIRPLLF